MISIDLRGLTAKKSDSSFCQILGTRRTMTEWFDDEVLNTAEDCEEVDSRIRTQIARRSVHRVTFENECRSRWADDCSHPWHAVFDVPRFEVGVPEIIFSIERGFVIDSRLMQIHIASEQLTRRNYQARVFAHSGENFAGAMQVKDRTHDLTVRFGEDFRCVRIGVGG